MKKTIIASFLLLTIFLSHNLSAQMPGQIQWDTYKYSGTIGGNPVIMTFVVGECAGCTMTGNYYYTKYNKKIDFRAPDPSSDSAQIVESVNGKKTGYFIFQPADAGLIDFPDKLIGKWYTMDGTKSYDVVLTIIK